MATNNSWNNQITAAGGPITLNSGTGAVNISSDASATTVNLGTGGAAKTVTLGSTNSTSTTTIQAGSAGVKFGSVAEGTLVTSSTSVISTVTGTSGYALKANTAGTSPSFQNFAGNLVLIQSIAASSSANVQFTTGVTGYDAYKIFIIGMIPQNNSSLGMTFSTDGGGTYESTNYYHSGNIYGSNGTIGGAFAANNATSNTIGGSISNSTTFALSAEIDLFLLGSSSVAKSGFSIATYRQTAAVELYTVQIGFALNLTTAVNAIKFTMASGNINSGTFNLYGVV